MGKPFGNSYLLLTQDTSQADQTWKADRSTSAFDTEIPYDYSTLFFFTGERMGHAIAR